MKHTLGGKGDRWLLPFHLNLKKERTEGTESDMGHLEHVKHRPLWPGSAAKQSKAPPSSGARGKNLPASVPLAPDAGNDAH